MAGPPSVIATSSAVRSVGHGSGPGEAGGLWEAPGAVEAAEDGDVEEAGPDAEGGDASAGSLDDGPGSSVAEAAAGGGAVGDVSPLGGKVGVTVAEHPPVMSTTARAAATGILT